MTDKQIVRLKKAILYKQLLEQELENIKRRIDEIKAEITLPQNELQAKLNELRMHGSIAIKQQLVPEHKTKFKAEEIDLSAKIEPVVNKSIKDCKKKSD